MHWMKEREKEIVKHMSIFAKIMSIVRELGNDVKVIHIKAHEAGSVHNEGNAVADYLANGIVTDRNDRSKIVTSNSIIETTHCQMLL